MRISRSARLALAAATAGAGLALAAPAQAETQFILRVYNAGEENGMTYADGSKADPLLSWGVYAVHEGASPIFAPGQPAGGEGLEDLAEDGNPFPLEKSLAADPAAKVSGVLRARPVDGEATIHPGMLFRVLFDANPGDRLSLAVMLEQSNDLFYAPPPEGIALFENGQPISGDLTDRVQFWDAGTEVNQPPGTGPDNGINQDRTNQGPDENGVVRLVDDEYTCPAIADVLRVTIEPR